MPSTYLHLALVSALAVSAVACTASSATSNDTGASDSDITGVTDLAEMESALGLSKDFKNADGTWYRGDDKLKAGACYKKLIGGPEGASYIFRRYSTGASFFKQLNAGAASGDERPVVCVDVDIEEWDGTTNHTSTYGMNDFEIDSVIRYRLGHPSGGDGAAGSTYEQFEGGAVHYVNLFCWPDASGNMSFSPLDKSELQKDCLSGAQFPGSGGEIDGRALLMVYQYAYNHSLAGNRFSADSDPVGRFIKIEGTWDSPDQIVHYENMDLHIQHETSGAVSSKTTVSLTPKGAALTGAVFTCVSGWNDSGSTTQCTGG